MICLLEYLRVKRGPSPDLFQPSGLAVTSGNMVIAKIIADFAFKIDQEAGLPYFYAHA